MLASGNSLINDSTISVRCDAVSNALGYVVYYGTDSATSPDSVISETNEIHITGLDELSACFIRIKSYNDAGCSNLNTKCYAAVPSANPWESLIVNGFDRSTNTRHDYVKQYIQPLIAAGSGFSYVLNESVYDGKISLCDYETVIWILGDESSADDTFNPVEQDSVENFLKQGGKLFVSGSEIGWDLEGKTGHPTQADKDFYHNFLKADYIADAPAGVSSTYYSATPILGEIFDGIDDFSFDNGTHGTFDVDWPDAINGINGGVNVMKYKNASSSNIAAISNSIDEESYILREYALHQNYPNPFNPTTTISFTLAKASNVRLEIFNIRGEKVRSLANGYFNAGYWTAVWDGKNDHGLSVPSGMYMYRMITGMGIQVKNMLLLK